MKTNRTFQEIANEIELTWPGPNQLLRGSAVYLEALQNFDTTDPTAIRNGQRAKDLVQAFITTSGMFRGRESYRLKKELCDNAGIELTLNDTYIL